MARQKPGTKRWQITVPPEEAQPKGPAECIWRAVSRLGPFKSKLHEDAQKTGPWSLDGRIALSEELAFEQSYMLATQFNKQEHLGRNAPRTKDVVERLKKLELLAGDLARFLESLDDITRSRLKTMGSGVAGSEHFFDLSHLPEADIAGLPDVSGQAEQKDRGSWIKRLTDLSQYANLTLKVFLAAGGIETVDAPDKGGSTNVYKHWSGTARWGLVSEGWHLFELFKPGQATGTEGGPFHLYLLDVFEFATNLDPEEHSKLTSFLKSQSKANRRYSEILKEIERLEKERDDIFGADPTSWNEVRAGEFRQKLFELERQRLDLWSALFPHTYGRSKSGQ